MEKNTNCLVSKVDLLNLLIDNGYHTQSIKALRKTVQSWIDDLQDDYSPVSYLGEKMFIRYLYYMLVYKLDCLIGNEKPFVPSQDYEQEYNRFIKGYLLPMNDRDAGTDETINNCSPFCESQNYGQELIRQCRASELIELVKQDSSFEELFFTIDCAIQDRFLRAMAETTTHITGCETNKLW